MTRRSRSMIATVVATAALAVALATTPPGHAALSDAELAATRGMSPGYPLQRDSTGNAIYSSCTVENRPASTPKTTSVNCGSATSGTACLTCQNQGTQPKADTSNPPALASGYVPAPQNQACGGPLLSGSCNNGMCVLPKQSGKMCNNPLPVYLQQALDDTGSF